MIAEVYESKRVCLPSSRRTELVDSATTHGSNVMAEDQSYPWER